MAEDPLLNELERRMDGALEVLRKEFGGLRTGRASAGLLDPVMVKAYGSDMPLNQVGHRQRARAAHDHGPGLGPRLVKAVDKAIREAGLGLNPQTDGQVDPRADPRPEQERRRELTKVAAQICRGGAGRGAQRAARRHRGAEASMEKDGEISQDEHASCTTRSRS